MIDNTIHLFIDSVENFNVYFIIFGRKKNKNISENQFYKFRNVCNARTKSHFSDKKKKRCSQTMIVLLSLFQLSFIF